MDNTNVLGRVHSFVVKEFAAKQSANGTRTIRGLANANTLDRSKEIVDPKAFKSSLDAYMENPVVFYNHEWDDAIGKVIGSKISGKGLEVEIEIGHGYEPADKVWTQINQGILKAFSIGFRPLKVEYDEEDDILTIKDLELFEVSVVTIPMNKESLFSMTENRATGVKLLDNGSYMSFKSLAEKTEKALSVTNNPEMVSATAEVSVTSETSTATETTPEAALATELQTVAAEKALELLETLQGVVVEKDKEIAELKSLREMELDLFKESQAKADARFATLQKELEVTKVKHLLAEVNFPALLESYLK